MTITQIIFLLMLISWAVNSWGQTIQVPEDCIDRVSPCLVRNEGQNFQFKIQNSKFSLVGGSILKIEKNSNEINLDLIDGYVSLVVPSSDKLKIKVEGSSLSEGRWMAARSPKRLDVLSLTDYQLKTFRRAGNAGAMELIKGEFINKKDFVTFTKNFFQNSNDYKKFVLSEAPRWKSEFNRQNNNQSKVLLRTIASEKEQSRIDAERKAQEEAQAKKLKSEFFYRTFNR